MECDVTRELLELSRAGMDAFKELLNFLLVVGKGSYILIESHNRKPEKYHTGLISPKTFFQQNTPAKSIGSAIPEDFQYELWNQLCKKYDFAYILKNNIDLNGDGKIDRSDTYMVVAQDKLQNYELALGEYYQITASKKFIQSQLPKEIEGMSEEQKAAVKSTQEKLYENFKMPDGQEKEISFNLFGKEQRERILRKIKEITRSEKPLDEESLLKLFDKSNFKIDTSTIDFTKDNRAIRAQLVEQIEKIAGEENVASFKADKGIFLVKDGEAIFIDLTKGKITTSPLNEQTKEKALNILSTINVQKLRKNKELEAAMQENYSKEKIDFIKQMEDECLIIPPANEFGWEEYPRQLLDNYNSIRNFLLYNERDQKELSSKAESLWQIAKSGSFIPEMINLDEESCWAIADAQHRLSKENVESLLKDDYTAFQRNVLILALEQDPNLSFNERLKICEAAQKKEEEVKYFCATNQFKETSKKMTLEDVSKIIAEQKLEYVQQYVQENIDLSEISTQDLHHVDEEGKWYCIHTKENTQVFINETKDSLKYQVSMSSENVSTEDLKVSYKTTGRNGKKYYRKGSDTLVDEKGRTIYQKVVKVNSKLKANQTGEKPKVRVKKMER